MNHDLMNDAAHNRLLRELPARVTRVRRRVAIGCAIGEASWTAAILESWKATC